MFSLDIDLHNQLKSAVSTISTYLQCLKETTGILKMERKSVGFCLWEDANIFQCVSKIYEYSPFFLVLVFNDPFECNKVSSVKEHTVVHCCVQGWRDLSGIDSSVFSGSAKTKLVFPLLCSDKVFAPPPLRALTQSVVFSFLCAK